MTYMQWNAALETGIAVIDEQHKRIIYYINELDQASQSGNANNIRHAMDGLIDYTITHFQFEEELQEKAGYPFLKAHKKVHDIFKKRVAAFAERANNGENVVPELMAMLKIWLSSHIKGDDSDYVESVKMIANSRNQEIDGWFAATLRRLFGAQGPVSRSGT